MRIHASKPVEWLQDGSAMDRVGFAGQAAKRRTTKGTKYHEGSSLMGILRALFVIFVV